MPFTSQLGTPLSTPGNIVPGLGGGPSNVATRLYARNMQTTPTPSFGEKSAALSVNDPDPTTYPPNSGTGNEDLALKLTKGSLEVERHVQGLGTLAISRMSYIARFTSDVLAAQTIPGATWTGAFAAHATSSGLMYIRISVYIWRPSTAAVVGYISDNPAQWAADVSGWGDQGADVRTFGGNSIVTQDGDVLVLEIWRERSQANFGVFTDYFHFDGATDVTDGMGHGDAASYIEGPDLLFFTPPPDEEPPPPPPPVLPPPPPPVCMGLAPDEPFCVADLKEFEYYITPDGCAYPLEVPEKRWILTQEGTGMPPIEYVSQRGPFQHGETVLDYFLRPRVVQLVIRHGNYTSRRGYWTGRANLLDALRPNRPPNIFGRRPRPGQLRKVFPNGSVLDLDVYIEQGPKYEPRRTDVWDELAFQEVLRFVAFNPIFYDPFTESIKCTLQTTVTQDEGAQLRFPASFPIYFSNLQSGGEGNENQCSQITYGGNWPEYPTIVLTGPLSQPKVHNLTTGELLELDYDVPEGATVTFDLTYGVKTVVLDEGGTLTNLIGFLTPESDLGSFHLEPGVNQVTLEASGVNFDSAIEIIWHKRYIGY